MAQDLNELNSLRQALTPYEDIKFELNLNGHPKAHKNKSIIHAMNMKLSKDCTVLENEESVIYDDYINDILNNYYQKGYSIKYVLPCNTELVLFVKENNKSTFDIWRYREQTTINNKLLALFYNKGIAYNGGEFSGTFTYTSNNSLIIAFCEYPYNNSRSFMSPMMTINLGTFTEGTADDNYNWISTVNEFNDRDLEPYKLPICPEVSLPQITNVSNIKGNSYIGTYYVYIRYKINKYDYTQWFNIGYPIINEYKQNTTIHEKVSVNGSGMKDTIIEIKDENKDTLIGAYKTTRTCKLNTYVNQNKDLINSCIDINIEHNNILYDYCQIGFICISKTYTKYYITSDIKLNKIINVSTNINSIKEEIFDTDIYENYFNVKNIINKNNKLYISNYVTADVNKNINIDNIKLSLKQLETIKNTDVTTNKITIGGIEFNEEDVLKTYNGTITKYINDDYETEVIPIKFISLPYFLKIHNLENWIVSKYCNYGTYSTGTKYELQDVFISVVRTTVNAEVNSSGVTSEEVLIVCNTKDGIENNHTRHRAQNFDFYIDSVISGNKAGYSNNSLTLVFIDDGIEQISRNSLNDNRYDFTETDDIYPEDYLTDKYYFNNLDNKINNNIITGLCKGEVYDFYIHFIDKYGTITNGYKIKNTDNRHAAYFNKIIADAVATIRYDVCFIKINDYCLIVPADFNIFINENDELKINLENWFIEVIDGEKLELSTTRLQNNIVVDVPEYITNSKSINNYDSEYIISELTKVIENLKYLQKDKLELLTYGDIFDLQLIGSENNYIKFIPYYNSQNELFFKVPKLISNEGDIKLGLKVEIGDIGNYGDYVSYFISHKKLEKIYVLNGFGTKNQINNILLNNKFESGNIVKVYNIKDKVNWDLELYDKCTIQEDIICKNGFDVYVNLLNKLAYANDSQLHRNDRQTTLYLSDSTKEFNGYPEDNVNIVRGVDAVKYIEILNLDKNKYINNKNLYRLGNIEYINCIINNGLNGRYDKHLAIKYGNNHNGVNSILSDTGLGTYGDVFLYEIYGFFDYEELGIYLSQSSKFHDIYEKRPSQLGGEYDFKLGTDTFYEVITTLNLFNYKISNIYDTWINFYNTFNKNDDFLKEFNRTVYRSSVISDEGRVNNWRYFKNDAYKNIEENKGNIVNILSIGNYLYVHTEHSLFAFSEDNTLSMNNQNLQVATPDIFNTEYKEVFITKLGYGGLQDKDAWIAGQFGYIWYDRDSKKIFKIYGNSMDIISNDIQEWLENAYIYGVKFANDIKNNRILIYFDVWNTDADAFDVILSYNTISKSFISFHDFAWSKSYNTKNELYYEYNNKICKYDKDNYGINLNLTKSYSISFIVNNHYREIKYLEYIIFKLRKRLIKDIDKSFNIINDKNQLPVEKSLVPYLPQGIRIYNDLVDTDNIQCNSINKDTSMPKNHIEDYKTPYWNLGNWHFNFLRDVEHYPNSEFDLLHDSRLFGNYFVITFSFGHVDTLIEFENLDVQLTKDKNL